MIIIGCGRAKLGKPAMAKDLYIGSLFRAARRYAEASGRPWLILSGKHGIITPKERIEPYDEGPPLLSKEQRLWALKAAVTLQRVMLELGEDGPVEVLAGKTYGDALDRALVDFGIGVLQPLAGLEMGYRLRRLKAMAESLQKGAASGAIQAGP